MNVWNEKGLTSQRSSQSDASYHLFMRHYITES